MNKKIHPEVLRRFGRDPKEIFERDGYICKTCKSSENLTIDHIDGNGRNSKNPNNDINNLQTLCRSCHGRKDAQRIKHEKYRHTNGGYVRIGETLLNKICILCGKRFTIWAANLQKVGSGRYCSHSCSAKGTKNYLLAIPARWREGVNI